MLQCFFITHTALFLLFFFFLKCSAPPQFPPFPPPPPSPVPGPRGAPGPPFSPVRGVARGGGAGGPRQQHVARRKPQEILGLTAELGAFDAVRPVTGQHQQR